MTFRVLGIMNTPILAALSLGLRCCSFGRREPSGEDGGLTYAHDRGQRRRDAGLAPAMRDDLPSPLRNEFQTQQKSMCCISGSEFKTTLEN